MPLVLDDPFRHRDKAVLDAPTETDSSGGGGGGGQIPVYDDNTVNTLNLELELDL